MASCEASPKLPKSVARWKLGAGNWELAKHDHHHRPGGKVPHLPVGLFFFVKLKIGLMAIDPTGVYIYGVRGGRWCNPPSGGVTPLPSW
jgi:hypothetical protein